MRRKVVGDILEVKELALVFDPATTKNLMESEASEEGIMDLAELKEKHPELVEQLRTEALAESDDQAKGRELTAKLKESETKVAEFEAKEAVAAKKTKAAELLEKSKLPKEARTEKVRAALEGCEDEKTMAALLESIEEAVRGMKGKPRSEERTGASGAGGDVKLEETVRTVKASR